jgi:hypothetical protein
MIFIAHYNGFIVKLVSGIEITVQRVIFVYVLLSNTTTLVLDVHLAILSGLLAASLLAGCWFGHLDAVCAVVAGGCFGFWFPVPEAKYPRCDAISRGQYNIYLSGLEKYYLII